MKAPRTNIKILFEEPPDARVLLDNFEITE
jgi:hypothetical protein